LPEDVINKLVPLRSASVPASSATAVAEKSVEKKTYVSTEVRSKLGYLNSGEIIVK
jgi:hypothetical protein